MAFDKQNFCWISFPNGIQKFDGKNFTQVPIQPGLADDKWVTFYRCKNGTLLLSHERGISKYDLQNNRFTEIFHHLNVTLSPARFIGETNALHFLTEDARIVSLDTATYAVLSSVKTGLPTNSYNESFLKISENIVDDKIAILINSRLYQWDLRQKKLTYSSGPIPDIFFTFLWSLPNDKALYHSFSNVHTLQVFDFRTGTSRIMRKDESYSGQGFRSSLYRWQDKLLFSFFNRLYETDTSFKILRRELVNFQNKPLAGTSAIGYLRQDNFGNLYLITVSGGFTKVIRHNLPIKYYGIAQRESNFVLSILTDKKKNRILAGTRDSGLFIFDTLQQVVKHITKLPGRPFGFSINAMAKDSRGDYLLFVPGEKKVWKLGSVSGLFTSLAITPLNQESIFGFSYFGKVLSQTDQHVYMQSQHMFYKVDLRTNKVGEFAFNKTKCISGLLYNGRIVTHGSDELLFYDTATFKELARISFPNTGGARCFAVNNKNELFIGTNKGVFRTDSTGKVLEHLNRQNGLADECIYAMVFDHDQNLWASTNKGVFRMNSRKGINHFKKEEGLQENEFNTNSVAIADDGELFFGGVNGSSSFMPGAMMKEDEDINLLFTSIKVNNKNIEGKAAWQIQNIAMPYDRNTVSFDFIALAKNYPGQYIYQYRMEGIDEEWLENSELQTVRYFLPPGAYVFQVYASRFFNKDAKPMKEIAIIIHPPFWKSWWFITCMVILTLGIMAVVIRQNYREHYKKKLAVLEAEHKIQLERERISRELHDDLGTRANMLVYSTSLIDEKITIDELREIRERIQEASGDMLLSLRETVWALKQEDITVTDVWTRFKNFLSKMQRTYAHIQFKMDDTECPERKLKYNEALNTIRILQEAVNNAVKHAECTLIRTNKSFNGSRFVFTISDNGKGIVEDSGKGSGSGIENMNHRAKDSGFDLTIESDIKSGTVITLTL